MKILLDTHFLIWLAASSDRLPALVRRFVEDAGNEVFFSSASIWELAIKYSSGKIGLELPPRLLYPAMLQQGFLELPVTASHSVEVETLQPIHKDPFDRILIAQALAEGMLLLTADETIARYPGPIRLIR